MKSTVYKINNDELSLIDSELNPELDLNENDYWIDISFDNKDSLTSELLRYGLKKKTIKQIESFDLNETIYLDENFILFRLMISNSIDIYSQDYFTFIHKPGLLITLINKDNTLLNSLSTELNNNPFKLKRNIFYVMYYMTNLIINTSTKNLNLGRTMVNKLQSQLDTKPEEVEINDIIKAKQNISNLTDIIENQHITLELLPKINWSVDSNSIESEIRKIIDRYSYIQNAANRLESKAKEMQLHYQLILQEKGNKKLNTLTIIQSIFVPLTLISGVYGMNFIVMPELNWANGYYFVLATMALIVLIELWVFRKNGWFD